MKKNEQGLSKSAIAGMYISKYGTAGGGNWSAMAMSAIKHGMKPVYNSLEDKEWYFEELCNIICDHVGYNMNELEEMYR